MIRHERVEMGLADKVGMQLDIRHVLTLSIHEHPAKPSSVWMLCWFWGQGRVGRHDFVSQQWTG